MSEEEKKVLNLILQKLEDIVELLLLTISNLTSKKALRKIVDIPVIYDFIDNNF